MANSTELLLGRNDDRAPPKRRQLPSTEHLHLQVGSLLLLHYSSFRPSSSYFITPLSVPLHYNAKLGGRAAQDWRVRGVKKRGAPFHCGARGKPCAAHAPKYEIS